MKELSRKRKPIEGGGVRRQLVASQATFQDIVLTLALAEGSSAARRLAGTVMLRWKQLQVTPSLFGEWCLLRMWGRIGRQGQLRADWFETRQAAEDALRRLETAKRRRGYRNTTQ